MITFPGIVAQLTSTLIISYISHEYNDVVPDVLLCTNGVIMVRYRFSLIADNPLINTNSIKTNKQTIIIKQQFNVITHSTYSSTYSTSLCCARNPTSMSVKHQLYTVVRQQLSVTHNSNKIQYNINTVCV